MPVKASWAEAPRQCLAHSGLSWELWARYPYCWPNVAALLFHTVVMSPSACSVMQRLTTDPTQQFLWSLMYQIYEKVNYSLQRQIGGSQGHCLFCMEQKGQLIKDCNNPEKFPNFPIKKNKQNTFETRDGWLSKGVYFWKYWYRIPGSMDECPASWPRWWIWGEDSV